MKKNLSFGLLMFISLFLSACTSADKPTEEAPAPTAGTYDQDSWRTMISDACQSFFDGCNNCNRAAGTNLTACTKMFCETYAEPKCLDEVEVEIQ